MKYQGGTKSARNAWLITRGEVKMRLGVDKKKKKARHGEPAAPVEKRPPPRATFYSPICFYFYSLLRNETFFLPPSFLVGLLFLGGKGKKIDVYSLLPFPG